MSDPSGQAAAAPAVAAPSAKDAPPLVTWRPSPPEKEDGKPPPRLWLRLVGVLAVLAALLALIGVITAVGGGHKAKRERAALEAGLDATDPGWRFEQLRQAGEEEIPDKENSAR